MTNDIEKLRQAVEQSCECSASHARSEVVIETFRGEGVLEGTVEIFALSGGPVERAYAWCYPEGNQVRYMRVDGKLPITDALSAVRAITSGKQK